MGTVQVDFDDETPPVIGRVGRYDVLSLLGTGGMGMVYRACLSGPGQSKKVVALKILHAHLSLESDFVEMFLTETRLAMALAHRNVVQSFDAGVADGRQFIVMEFIDGCSLRDLMKSFDAHRRLPLPLALFIAREICAALEYAHSYSGVAARHGVIHRDVSPGNVLISSHGDLKLADFGVAKALSALQETSVSHVKGKLHYMPPEQLAGRAERRSDLYALGVVLHELVTGEAWKDHASDSASKSSGSKRSEGENDEVFADVMKLIACCTDNDPARRPQTAAELGRSLQQQLDRAQAMRRAQRGQAQALALGPHQELAAIISATVASKKVIGAPDQALQIAQRLLHGPSARPPGVSQASTAISRAPKEKRRWPTALLTVGLAIAAFGLLWWALSVPDDLRDQGAITSPTLPTQKRRTVSDDRPLDGATHPRASVVESKAALELSPISSDGGMDRGPIAAAIVRPKKQVQSPPPRRRRKTRYGRLHLNAVPWAVVYVGNRRVGETPLQGLRLRSGTHRVRVVNEGLGLQRTLIVRIRPNATVRRVIRLER